MRTTLRLSLATVALIVLLAAVRFKGKTVLDAALPTKGRGPGRIAHVYYPPVISNEKQLFIGHSDEHNSSTDPFQDAVYALDLSVSWSAADPAWSRMERPPGFENSRYEFLALDKNGSNLYLSNPNHVMAPYNIDQGRWGQPFKASGDYYFARDIVADTKIYRLAYCIDGRSYQQCLQRSDNDTSSSTQVTTFPDGDGSMALQSHGVYSRTSNSRTSNSLFFYSYKKPEGFYRYDISGNTWTLVIASGTKPSSRQGACFVSHNRSNKLILAGGADYNFTKIMEQNPPSNVVLSDLYTFDTKTYVWTRLADTPVGYYEAVCTVAGDSLILYGGYNHHYYPHESGEEDQIFNNVTPSIYNLKESAWVTTYTPSSD